MAFVEPLDAFFGDFNSVAIWKNRSINVIFDNEYSMNYEMAGSSPVMTVKASDMPGVKRSDSLEINGVVYVIQNPPQPDGQGLLRIELEKQ